MFCNSMFSYLDIRLIPHFLNPDTVTPSLTQQSCSPRGGAVLPIALLLLHHQGMGGIRIGGRGAG